MRLLRFTRVETGTGYLSSDFTERSIVFALFDGAKLQIKDERFSTVEEARKIGIKHRSELK